MILLLQHCCRLFTKARQNLSIDDDWVHACHHFGITTFYRREADGSLSVKLDGELKDVPLFEQICVLKEVDLHYLWAPFCSSSMTIADLDKIDTVGWFLIGMPNFGIARDGCFRAIGCDCIEDDGTILLTAQGIQDRKHNAARPDDTFLSDDPIIQKLEIPPVPKRKGSGRMTIKKFEALIQITSPTSAHTRIVANVDPNLSFLPQSLLEFVMKHMAGVLLAKLQGAAKKVTKHPVNNEHAKRMRAEKAFYQDWLMTKFKALCVQKQWEMPHVLAFDYTDEKSLHYHRAVTFNGVDCASTVVENISTVSDPETRQHGDDSISQLSAASIWSKNPLSVYLREIENRTRRKKQEKVEASRKIARDRLKPKRIPVRKLQRLEELKGMRSHRMNLSKIDDLSDKKVDYSTLPSRPMTLAQCATASLHTHPVWLRSLVIILLLVSQSVVLHAESISLFVGQVSVSFLPPGLSTLLGAAKTVLYLLVCATIDYMLCFVALIYTFSSLDLGAKSGIRIRRYYADNMALLAAGKSFTIVGISLVKASAGLLLQYVVRCIVRLLSIFAGASFQISNACNDMEALKPFQLYRLFLPAFGGLNWIVTQGCIVFCEGFARLGESITAKADKLVCLVADETEQRSLGANETSFLIWRKHAIDTSRVLFVYSSVFLLVFLFLFASAAVRSRPVGPTIELRTTKLPSSFIKQQMSTASELSEG